VTTLRIQKLLIDLWRDIFSCKQCNLPVDYIPTFRPLGNLYQENGVVFAQINPGHIGWLTDSEIDERYKSESARHRARYKRKVTSDLLLLQDHFLKNPSIQNWKLLNIGYRNAMIRVWGWPPGKYSETIERHGVAIQEIAVVNIAQCPIPGDKYSKQIFSNCWRLHTERLLRILKPKLIVAQGKVCLNFLQNQDLDNNSTLVEGNHHASRQSNEVKNRIFNNVKSVIEQLRA